MRKLRFLSTFCSVLLFAGVTVSCSNDSGSDKPCTGDNCNQPCEGENCEIEDPCEDVDCNGGTCEDGICSCDGLDAKYTYDETDCHKKGCANGGSLKDDCKAPCENVNCNGGTCEDGICSCDGLDDKYTYDEADCRKKGCANGESLETDCKTPCEDVNCNGGVCINGTCSCDGLDDRYLYDTADCHKTGCANGKSLEKDCDEGSVEEEIAQTDDKDVLEGITLPQNKQLSNDPCLACTHAQECKINTCVNSTIHNVNVNKAFTDENGDKATFSISLTRSPTHDVTFECWIESTSPFPEAKIECPGKIAAGDWQVFQFSARTSEQIITVTGLPDQIDDGDQKYIVMLKTVSEDPYFGGVVHSPMEFTNRNVDHAGVSWHADQALLTGEDGRKAAYTLVLNSKPLAPVKLKLHSSDVTEGTAEPKTLIFTPENWSVPQTVTVTGTDDNYKDDTVEYSILTTSVSADPKYNNIKIDDVVLKNLDNDKPAITISSSTYKLTPSKSKTTVSVTLSTQPTSDVEVGLFKLTDSPIWKINQEKLVFTTENWNTPQTVDIEFDNPNEAKTAITLSCLYGFSSSEDTTHDMLTSNMQCFDLYRYEPMNFEYSGKEEKLTLVPGEYKLEAWGSQGGGSLNSLGGYGGYSYGKVEFKEVTDLYINAGGIPYNGGGQAQANGGGATHIATESGLLSTLESKRDSVLIVAGGGGGSERTPGGYGGGETGGIGNEYTYVTKIPTGATQTAGGERGETSMYGVGTAGSFGQGGDGIGQIDYEHNPNPHLDSGGGGGGGWYGGGGVPYAGGGGGGSGHIGKGVTGETIAGSGEQSFESPTGGRELGHAGTGYARISIIERELPKVN